jgi:hypothetical protein
MNKKIFTPIALAIIIILVILVLGFLGWQFLFKKSTEGGSCNFEKNCQAGLKCINNICSSRKAGSVCVSKTDCLTPFCVNGKCTEGKKDDVCLTYKECEKGLFCEKGICSEPPSYSQYFDKIVVSKMKLGMPPGPNNISVPTAEFKTTDAIEIDFVGVKSIAKGEVYYEAIDLITGEVVFTSSSYKIKLEGRDTGTGSDLPRAVGTGEFDLNIYYNDEVVYTTMIKITD